MLEGQIAAIAALFSQQAKLAEAAEAAAARLLQGGRLIYVGAGTSGRIAVQDGVELTPTYNWPSDRVVFVLAGGLKALAESAEGAEDDRSDAIGQIHEAKAGPSDVVIGVAASGVTPFTVAAVGEARVIRSKRSRIANMVDPRFSSSKTSKNRFQPTIKSWLEFAQLRSIHSISRSVVCGSCARFPGCANRKTHV